MKINHKFVHPKGNAYLLTCDNCGHIPLKNKISEIVTRAGCEYHNDSQYLRWIKNGRKFLND